MKHHPATLTTHLGRNPASTEGTVNMPTARASTMIFPDLAAYDRADKGQYEKSSYGTHGTQTTLALAEALAELEGGDACYLSSNGLQAITTSLLAFLKAGDHLLMVDSVYGPTRRFCDGMLRHWGVEVEYYDPLIGGGIAKLMKANTKVVFVESPGSLTFEVQDVPAIAEVAHAYDAVVVSDGTWATPLHQKPFDLGVDVSLHAITKYIGGHADVLMGAVICKKKHKAALEKAHTVLGVCSNSDEAFLALRGLRTLPVRLKHHEQSALKIAEWLQERDEVLKILHPAFEDCPGHALFTRDFSGSNGLFTFLLKPYAREAVAAMLDGMELFSMGYSWGGFESLLIPFEAKGIRTASTWQHDGLCLRLHAGLEDVDDLIADLDAGLERLTA